MFDAIKVKLYLKDEHIEMFNQGFGTYRKVRNELLAWYNRMYPQTFHAQTKQTKVELFHDIQDFDEVRSA